ncbi:unnamed protein product [Ixodes pacificus]
MRSNFQTNRWKVLKMAFQPPTARQELQNRKILEELQQKKQLLLKQGQGNASPAALPATVSQTCRQSNAMLNLTRSSE